MSLTYTRISGGEGSWGQLRFKLFDVLWDSSYPTGGEVLSTASIGLQNIVGAQYVGAADATSAGILPIFKRSTTKLLAMRFTPTGTVAAPTFTGAAHTHTLNFKNAAVADGATTRVNVGTNLLGANSGGDLAVAGNGANGGVANSTAAGTNSAPAFTGTEASLIEVGNTTDLSLVTHTIMFIGN